MSQGKKQYFYCQKKVNGYLLDTKDHIQNAACKRPYRTPAVSFGIKLMDDGFLNLGKLN